MTSPSEQLPALGIANGNDPVTRLHVRAQLQHLTKGLTGLNECEIIAQRTHRTRLSRRRQSGGWRSRPAPPGVRCAAPRRDGGAARAGVTSQVARGFRVVELAILYRRSAGTKLLERRGDGGGP